MVGEVLGGQRVSRDPNQCGGRCIGQQGSGRLCGRAYADLDDGRGSRAMDAIVLWLLGGRLGPTRDGDYRDISWCGCAASPADGGSSITAAGKCPWMVLEAEARSARSAVGGSKHAAEEGLGESPGMR